LQTYKISDNIMPDMEWVRVKFLTEKKTSSPVKGRFCELVHQAMIDNKKIIVGEENIECEGARIAFGWQKDFRNFEQKFSSSNGVDIGFIDRALKSLQLCNTNIKSIILNGEEADVMVSFVWPEEMMEILKLFFLHTGKILKADLRPFLSVCLQTVIAWRTNYPTVSFGCKDSRLYAGIERDKLVVVLPYSMYDGMVKKKIA